MLNKFDNRFGLTSLSKRGKGKRRERGNGSSWTASDKSTIPKESLSVAKIHWRKKEKKGGRWRRRKDSGADNWGNGVIRYCDGNRAPLQGGSGWSISGALYVTNLRTRPSLMPVRGPW